MKTWIKDGKPVFLPIAGAVPAGDAVEVVDEHNPDTHEPGAVLGISVVNGVVTVRRQAKFKDGKRVKKDQLVKDAAKANNVADLKAIVRELVELL
jgi:hypothetical protein